MAEDEPQEETAEESEAGEKIDIELEEPQAPGRRGVGVGTLIVLVIIIAALVWCLFWAIDQARQRDERAREVREQGYQAQVVKIGRDLDAAREANEQGDVAAAIQALEAAASRIGDVASSAAAAGDDEYTQLLNLKKQAAEAAVGEATAKQAELQELLTEKLADVQRSLGVKVVEPAEPEEEADVPEEVEPSVEPESPAVEPVPPPGPPPAEVQPPSPPSAEPGPPL